MALVSRQMIDEWKQSPAAPSANTETTAVLVAAGSVRIDTRTLSAHLDAHGYRAEVVAPGDLAAAEAGGWQFLVCDLEAAAHLAPQPLARAPYRILLIPPGSPDDAIRALSELGAVALLESPPHPGVLAATLDSLCRRLGTEPPRSRQRMRAGEETNCWQLRLKLWSLVSPSGRTVSLSHAETNFLLALAKAPGEAVSRHDLIVALGHKPDYYDSRRLDTFVSRLRQKVAGGCGMPLPLRSIHAHGYAFASPILAED